MGEKRFELDRIGIFDNKTNHFYYKTFDNEDVVDLLNQLWEENEQLKEENKRLKRNVKTFKEDRDSNFKSTQYFREQLMKIPESIREVWLE